MPFPQLPGPKSQPHDHQRQQPDAHLEYRACPEPDVLDVFPSHARPKHGLKLSRSSGHESEEYEPDESQKSNANQNCPPSGDGCRPDPMLKGVVHRGQLSIVIEDLVCVRTGYRLFRRSLLVRLRHPEKPIAIAQLHSSHEDDLLRVTAKVRHAIEDGRNHRLIGCLNPAAFENAAC